MIKDEQITVKITMFNREYYRELGFDLHDGKGQFVTVPAKQVKPDSGIKVTRICDSCGDEALLQRDKVKDLCFKCAMVRKNKARAMPEKTTCPKCGAKKSYKATTCFKCKDQTGSNNPMFGKSNPRSAESNAKRSGEKHWNWKGGVTDGRSAKVIAWAKKVKAGKVCDCCTYSNPMALDAHHLESFDVDESLRYEVSNGVCLCKNCHTVFHKIYGFGDNTTGQYLEYKEKYYGSN